MTKIFFEGIQRIIIDELKQAKQKVYIAVAWFTNERIFSELIKLLDKRVEISLVILDDFINNGPFGLDFTLFIEKGGKFYYSTNENPVHHKFCIIDENRVLSGSYNWTYYAEYKNYENAILLTDKIQADSYSIEFNKIIQALDQRTEAIKYLDWESPDNDIFSPKEYLANDILFHGISLNSLELMEQAKKVNSTNIDFISMASLQIEELKSRSTSSINSKVAKPIITGSSNIIGQNKPTVTKLAYGINARINGVDDRFAIIINKNEKLPVKHSSIFYTTEDNQTEISVDTYKGEQEQVNENLLLGKMNIKDLPPLPARQASIKITFAMDINGTLNVNVLSTHTGNSLESNYYNCL